MILIILAIFVLVIGLSIYASFNPAFCLYASFAVNPINNGTVDRTRIDNIEFKNNVLSIKTGIIKKEVLFSEPISECDMLFDREYTPKEVEVVEKDKSVIGRAVVGGVLLGPIGAIVGGMSGIGTKKNEKITQKEKNDIYVTISSKDKEFLYKVAIANNDAANAIYRTFYNLKKSLA